MTDLMITLAIFDASSIFQWVTENASYWLVFVLMVIESSFIPFPSEVIVPPAAYLAVTRGDMNVFLIVLVATAGALVGAIINYYLALWIGRPIVYSFASSRIGRMCLLSPEKVEHAEKYFDEHGAASTFIGRLVPAVRQLISIPAGLARMNILTFVVFTSLGAAVWNAVLAALGYWLGRTVPYDQLFAKVEQYNDYLTYAGLAIGAACVLYILYKGFANKNTIKKQL